MKTSSKSTTQLTLALLGLLLSLVGLNTIDAQSLYFSKSSEIDEIANDGTVSTFVKGVSNCTSLTFNQSGDLFAAESGKGIIDKITTNGEMSIFSSELPANISFTGMAFDSLGNLFVAYCNGDGFQTGPGGIKKITPDGTVSTFASTQDNVCALTINSKDELFVACSNHIVKITPDGTACTFAIVQGVATALEVNSIGTLFVGYQKAEFVSEISPEGTVSVFAQCKLSLISGLAFDPFGNLFVSSLVDSRDCEGPGSGAICKITKNGGERTFVAGLDYPVSLAFTPQSSSVWGNIASNRDWGSGTNLTAYTTQSPGTLQDGRSVSDGNLDIGGGVLTNAPSITNGTIENGTINVGSNILTLNAGTIDTNVSIVARGLTKAGPGILTLLCGKNITLADHNIVVAGGSLVASEKTLDGQDIEDNANLTFKLTNAGKYRGASNGITGAGELTIAQGDGELTLTGDADKKNSYKGGTIIYGGLAIENGGGLGSGPVSLSGGLLDLNLRTLTNTLGPLTLGGQIQNGTVINNGGTYILKDGNVFVILSGSNRVLVNGTDYGVVTLELKNSYTGGTTVSGGTLVLNLDNYPKATLGTGGLNVVGGIIDFGGSSFSTVSNALTMTKGTIENGTINNAGDTLTLAGGTIRANIIGKGGLTKSGPGSLILAADNLFTGATCVSSGTLLIKPSGSLLGMGPVNVARDGGIQNNGIITGDVSVAGKLAGNQGNFTKLTLESGSSIIWNVQRFEGNSVANRDVLNVQTLDLSKLNSSNPLTIFVQGYAGFGSTNTTYKFGFLNVSGKMIGFEPSHFLVNTSRLRGDPNLSSGDWCVETIIDGGKTELILVCARAHSPQSPPSSASSR